MGTTWSNHMGIESQTKLPPSSSSSLLMGRQSNSNLKHQSLNVNSESKSFLILSNHSIAKLDDNKFDQTDHPNLVYDSPNFQTFSFKRVSLLNNLFCKQSKSNEPKLEIFHRSNIHQLNVKLNHQSTPMIASYNNNNTKLKNNLISSKQNISSSTMEIPNYHRHHRFAYDTTSNDNNLNYYYRYGAKDQDNLDNSDLIETKCNDKFVNMHDQTQSLNPDHRNKPLVMIPSPDYDIITDLIRKQKIQHPNYRYSHCFDHSNDFAFPNDTIFYPNLSITHGPSLVDLRYVTKRPPNSILNHLKPIKQTDNGEHLCQTMDQFKSKNSLVVRTNSVTNNYNESLLAQSNLKPQSCHQNCINYRKSLPTQLPLRRTSLFNENSVQFVLNQPQKPNQTKLGNQFYYPQNHQSKHHYDDNQYHHHHHQHNHSVHQYGFSKRHKTRLNRSSSLLPDTNQTGKYGSPTKSQILPHSPSNYHFGYINSNIKQQKQTDKWKNLTKSISCYALKFFTVANPYNQHTTSTKSRRSKSDLTNFHQINLRHKTNRMIPNQTGKNSMKMDHSNYSNLSKNMSTCLDLVGSCQINRDQYSNDQLNFNHSYYRLFDLSSNMSPTRLIDSGHLNELKNQFSFTNNTMNSSRFNQNYRRQQHHQMQQPIFKASTSELLECLSLFIVAQIQLNLIDLSNLKLQNQNNLKSIKPNIIVTWIKAIDKSLLIQGWSDVSFINPTHIVFLYMMLKDFVQSEIRTDSELHTIIMACLYVAYSYIGNEISYPLRPFLIAETNQWMNQNKHARSIKNGFIGSRSRLGFGYHHGLIQSVDGSLTDEIRNRFWQYVMQIINEKSTDMLRINADPMLFTKMLRELKSYEKCLIDFKSDGSSIYYHHKHHN